MKNAGILNPSLIAAVSSLGHTEYFVIADPGLPIPEGPEVIDLSLVRKIPAFLEVLDAVQKELVVESCIIAKEMEEKSPVLYHETVKLLGELPCQKVPHEELKQLVQKAKFVLRTGETTSFANIVLVGGVNF